MDQDTKEKIAEEISKIIVSCKAIRRLTNETTIPEEYIYNPKGDGLINTKLGNTKVAIEIALKQLDHAYNINPLKDDHALTMYISNLRSDLYQLVEYYKGLIR